MQRSLREPGTAIFPPATTMGGRHTHAVQWVKRAPTRTNHGIAQRDVRTQEEIIHHATVREDGTYYRLFALDGTLYRVDDMVLVGCADEDPALCRITSLWVDHDGNKMVELQQGDDDEERDEIEIEGLISLRKPATKASGGEKKAAAASAKNANSALYERAAIEEWFEKKKFKETESIASKEVEVQRVRSPSTNEIMYLDLKDATQIQITIQHLVQSGLVDDDKAAAVKEQLALEKAANEGDGDALYEMGRKHKAKIFKQNGDWDDKYGAMTAVYEEEESWGHWWKKGARLHNPKCMAAYGQYLTRDIDGDGLRHDDELKALGDRYLYQAAVNVDLAAYTIGCAVLYRDIQIDQRANQKFSTKEQVKWNGLSAEKRMKWLSRRNREEAKYCG